MARINTKNCERRILSLPTVDQCVAELDRIAAAARAGALEVTGNWTAGQIMAHLAAWIEYGYDGYPIKAPPFFMRWISKLVMKRMIRKGIPAGFKIPGVPDGTTGQEDMELHAGIARYKMALARMQNEPAVHFSPAFGKVSEALREKMNLRHAELHLGFVKYPLTAAPGTQ